MRGGNTKNRLKVLEEKIRAVALARKKRGNFQGKGPMDAISLRKAEYELYGAYYVGFGSGQQVYMGPMPDDQLVERICPLCRHVDDACEDGGPICFRFKPAADDWGHMTAILDTLASVPGCAGIPYTADDPGTIGN